MNNEEMKEKYKDYIDEVAQVLGLGKPIDIIKLCIVTDDFFKPLQKRIAELEETIANLKEQVRDNENI